jgi:zinc transport system substrate-binding protein
MKKNQFNRLFLITFALVFFSILLPLKTALAEDTNKKNIVVTLKPLEGLVLAIARDTVNLQRLLPDYTSPHHYHFKPSDIRKINAADIIFRIDEKMERFLSSFLLTQPHHHVISLADVPKIKLLSTKKMAIEASHSTHNKHEHHHNDQDLHIWMLPYNGIVMAEKITEELSRLNPQHQLFYQKNLSQFTQKIKHFTKNFQHQAKSLQNEPYFVFHDSWHYFSNRFQLKKIANLNLHEDIQLGVKTMRNTRKKIKQLQVHCLFSEPNFRPRTIATLTEGFNINTTQLDTLGSHLNTGSDLYLELLRYTSQQIKNCLKG